MKFYEILWNYIDFNELNILLVAWLSLINSILVFIVFNLKSEWLAIYSLDSISSFLPENNFTWKLYNSKIYITNDEILCWAKEGSVEWSVE